MKLTVGVSETKMSIKFGGNETPLVHDCTMAAVYIDRWDRRIISMLDGNVRIMFDSEFYIWFCNIVLLL